MNHSTGASRHFSGTYAEARAKFLEAGAQSGASIESIVLRAHRGALGEELATDVALLGAKDANKLLLVSSGTHGPEGFCGSGAQVARFVGRRRRPSAWECQRFHLGIVRIDRQRRTEVDVVAVEVDVVLVRAMQVREPVRVDGMHHQQRHAGLLQALEQFGEIRQQVRDAFYCDNDEWKGMVLGQTRVALLQTLQDCERPESFTESFPQP